MARSDSIRSLTNGVSKFAIIAIIAAGAASPVLAQPRPDKGREAVPTAPPWTGQAYSLKELQSGKLRIAVSADARETAAWRRDALQALWAEVMPKDRPLNREELDRLLQGDVRVLPDRSRPWVVNIVNGTPTATLSPWGMLLKGDGSEYAPECSVTLTGPDTVLTAAHCVEHLAEGTKLLVYLPHEGIRDVADDGISQFAPAQGIASISADDLALLTLSEPYTVLPFGRLGDASNAAAGSATTILGFGYDVRINSDFGILREGAAVLDVCDTCPASRVSDPNTLCFDFDPQGVTAASVGVHGNQGYDSGGPMVANVSPAHSLVGVASSIDLACASGSVEEGQYVDLNSERYQSWVEAGFCSPGCVTTSDDNVVFAVEPEAIRYVGKSTTLAIHELQIPPRTKRLFITLNHQYGDAGPLASDLDIVEPDELEAECRRYRSAEACTVEQPPAGDYDLGVARVVGDPAYQLSAVAVVCHNQACWDQFLAPND